MYKNIRNVAIIAHVDHGKTTLVDKLLIAANSFDSHKEFTERFMDSNDLEKERGITILAKNVSIEYKGIKINIIDTPGHADFGGEVERILGMVDGVLLLVDAVDGPMPQTRFVTNKALERGITPIVVINKIDREGARADWVVDQTFDLLDKLGANDEQLNFPIIYSSALLGYASLELNKHKDNMYDLFETILTHVPDVEINSDEDQLSLQLQIAALDYSNFLGRIAIGRITRGAIYSGKQVVVATQNKQYTATIDKIFVLDGINRVAVNKASVGDIVLVTGIADVGIGDTICGKENPQPLSQIYISEPTLSMNFQVNKSPFSGTEGELITSRQIKGRLQKELLTNTALRVEDTADTDVFLVSGRGELHLTILIENMRREGFEIAVAKPKVLTRTIDGVLYEPYELLTLDLDVNYQGAVMEEIGYRKGELKDLIVNNDRVRMEYIIPTRGILGLQSYFLTLTKGTGIISHIFDKYDKAKPDVIKRKNGVLVSQENGSTTAYSLYSFEDRGKLFIGAGVKVYEGMIIGIHNRENDLVVNPIKGKKLTNIRASGKDDAISLTPPIQLTLESAIEFISDDELLEVTPKSLRLRKKLLTENERKRASRNK